MKITTSKQSRTWKKVWKIFLTLESYLAKMVNRGVIAPLRVFKAPFIVFGVNKTTTV